MLFCIADASHPVKYISCGNLLSTDGFLHDRRRMDCFVFIIVTQGTLHLHQEGHNLDIGENQSVLLFPGKLHYGSRPSKGKLSYYWAIFQGMPPTFIFAIKTLWKNGGMLGKNSLYP